MNKSMWNFERNAAIQLTQGVVEEKETACKVYFCGELYAYANRWKGSEPALINEGALYGLIVRCNTGEKNKMN